jgi:hypothetical protein
MAIDRIPGVGPQNSDIATATAAAVPTIGAITTAITSNAASSGVTMAAITSAITTNAASSGVTMAAITSAITTNAASSGVTLAAIGTQVANNASPYGGTWADLGTYTGNSGAATVTFSSLSGYKYLRLYCMYGFGSSTLASIRFNGDSSTVYANALMNSSGNSERTIGGDSIYIPSATTTTGAFVLEIYGSNSSTLKHWTIYPASLLSAGSQPYLGGGIGVYKSTSAISSLTVNGGANFNGNTYMSLRGAN